MGNIIQKDVDKFWNTIVNCRYNFWYFLIRERTVVMVVYTY